MLKQVFSAIVAIAIIAGVWFTTFGRQADVPVQRNGWSGAQGQTTTVVFGEIEVTPFAEEYRAIGTARALENVDVVADVAGRIEAIHAAGNTLVTEGAPLVSLERNVQRINAQIAQSRLQQARDTLERYEALQAGSSGSVSRVAVRDASTNLAIAEAELALAREELERRVIRAPISGRLGLMDLDRGDNLAVGSRIVTIDNTDLMIVEFELPERAVPLLAIGRAVSLHTTLLRGRPLRGQIIAYDTRLDAVTRTITVRAEVGNSDGLLWPGMTLNVLLAQQSEPMPSAPAMAVTWTRDGAQIWRVDDGAAVAVPVVVRARIDDVVWLEGDLEQGTRIVIEGAQKLRSGTPVAQPSAANADPA
ncbi:MAG: efflux RND transporter periplasmic adaptor subunit [Rhodobacteraceae bacterium]|nr:efflux RND transporter periplasmic adaptor subunit [Paracoccaceae bacterium]